MTDSLISSHIGVISTLALVCSFFFFLEKKTGWKLFNFFPPLLFIYLVPVALSNSGILPRSSGVYDFMGDNILPVFLVVMLLDVDLLATVRVMGKGIFVMLLGTLGQPVVGSVTGDGEVGIGQGFWSGGGGAGARTAIYLPLVLRQ